MSSLPCLKDDSEKAAVIYKVDSHVYQDLPILSYSSLQIVEFTGCNELHARKTAERHGYDVGAATRDCLDNPDSKSIHCRL